MTTELQDKTTEPAIDGEPTAIGIMPGNHGKYRVGPVFHSQAGWCFTGTFGSSLYRNEQAAVDVLAYWTRRLNVTTVVGEDHIR